MFKQALLRTVGSLQVVPQYERAVIFRLGRIKDDEAKGPGVFFLLPCMDRFTAIDIRTKSFDVPPQRVRGRGRLSLSMCHLPSLL